MKRAGTSKAQVAGAAFLVALVALGAIYLATSPQKAATVSTTQTESSTQTSAQTSTSQSASTATTSTLTSAARTSSSSTASSSSSSTSAAGRISHVIVVLMENEEYGNVIGSSSAPYQNKLAATYALAANYFGVAHPSLPNYLALVAGGTFGVTSDCQPAQCSLPSNVTTIATLLDSHLLSWKEYAESMPANCSQVISPDSLYYPKHNPFVYFSAITGNGGTGSPSGYCDSHVVSMAQFYLDLQSGGLPNYSFVTPNICHDAHSCPLSTADQWLSTFVPKVINSSSFATTALFITYDEGSTNDTRAGGGQVACIVVSPFAKAGYVSHVEYTHYSLLATVEGIFGLGSLGRNDASATAMGDLFSPSAQIP
ncbi:MAG TPA: alkaline phosphatase family protein [Nitrososphaerales archaeon]|nr:alkaline phosphatase family protein [Nitrososphaerales archaeon]